MSYIRKRKSKKAGTIVQEIITDERSLSEWISEHVNTLIYAGGAILFVLFISLGLIWVKSHKEKVASEDMSVALRTYWNTIAKQPSDDPDADKMALEQVLENFAEVADEHGKKPQGQTASVYRARILFKLERFEEAARVLEEMEKGSAAFLSDVNARYLLAKSYEASGEFQKAIDVYSRIKEGSISEMSAVLAMDIARCDELKGDLDQAISAYREVLADYPDSVLAVKAEKKLVTLGVITREEI